MDNLIHNFSIKSVADFFKFKISSFSPNSENFNYILSDNDFTNFTDLKKTGEVEFNNSDELIVFTCKFQGVLSERSSKKKQFEIAKKVLKEDFKDGAIFIFYDNNGCFRFSFIRKNYGNKDQKFSNWKRYTYFVDPTKTNKTFKNRINGCNFSSLEDIQEAFSVEKLNKKFYEEIATAFYSLIGGKVSINKKEVSFNSCLQLPSTPVENRKVYQEFAVRLIGRTIFCWFLKNKKSDSGLPLIPEEWLSSKMVAEVNNQQHNYYHSIIEKLFFLILNKKQEDRKPYDLPKGQESVPFLNGGLFEAQVDDFFPKDHKGIHSPNFALNIPNTWFKDFFEVLEQYNFTIDENSINDYEVSIDPEMLGTIFENLLAEIDPDTEKSARKSTGSFYTPRMIVDYMVEQSLLQYIKTKTKIEDEEQLEILLKDDTENPFNEKQTITILEALSVVKILYPACGSGAFPMGVLHKIIALLKKLDKGAVWWKQNQLDKIENVLVKNAMKAKLNQANSDYIRKLGVIQHSIYGVDIQPIAAEISKLRSFLSLIIDENIVDNHPDGNRGIEPLPNLEFKFVTANTLISLDKGNTIGKDMTFDFGETSDLQNQLQKIRSAYLQATPIDKQKLKTDFEKLQTQIYKNELKAGGQNKRAQQLSAWKPFSNDSSTWFDPDWMFGVEKFDVVIGNPPYSVFQGKSKNDLEVLMKNKIYEKAKGGKINAFELFLCKVPELLKKDGINCQIFQNSFLADNSSSKLRNFYLTKQRIISINSYPERDDPKKRVFENVKMSVCILLNKNSEIKNYDFDVDFWDDKYKNSGKSIVYNNNEIIEFNKEQNVIYNLNVIEKKIFEKYFVNNKIKYSDYFDCLEGELNMTFHKDYLINDKTKPLVVKGAQVQRYFVTETPSQGRVEYVDEKRYLNDYSGSKKSQHHKKLRIAMQGITGANDKIRIVATLINEGIYLANSCNYIIDVSNDMRYSLSFLLGIFNSKFTNWIFRRSSTNSNVNCYEVNNLKLPKYSKVLFERIGNYSLLSLNNKNTEYQVEIDIMVYKIYELDYEEVLIVEPEFKLSKKDYDNYSIK